MMRAWKILVCLLLLVVSVHAVEMTGGYYAVEISAITAGGGSAEAGGVQSVWGAVAQPLAQGKSSGGGYSLFSGVYTPVIPEATAVLPALLGLAMVRRRR
jgi:hypothetical protein